MLKAVLATMTYRDEFKEDEIKSYTHLYYIDCERLVTWGDAIEWMKSELLSAIEGDPKDTKFYGTLMELEQAAIVEKMINGEEE